MKFYENDIIEYDFEQGKILFKNGIDEYVVKLETQKTPKVLKAGDIKLIRPYLIDMINKLIYKDYEVLTNEFKILEAVNGFIPVHDVKIRKNDYLFSCFADTETVIKQMKIEGLL